MTMLYSGAASLIGGLIGFLFGIPQSNVAALSSSAAGATPTASEATGGAARSQYSAISEIGAVAEGEALRGSGLHRNTNLESISDALTKGLLAIGASQLYRLRTWVGDIATALGDSFGPGNAGQIVALSVLAYGTIEGFLFGYLATRIYLTGVFERSDPRL